jgi:hypothetical protein
LQSLPYKMTRIERDQAGHSCEQPYPIAQSVLITRICGGER